VHLALAFARLAGAGSAVAGAAATVGLVDRGSVHVGTGRCKLSGLVIVCGQNALAFARLAGAAVNGEVSWQFFS